MDLMHALFHTLSGFIIGAGINYGVSRDFFIDTPRYPKTVNTVITTLAFSGCWHSLRPDKTGSEFLIETAEAQAGAQLGLLIKF